MNNTKGWLEFGLIYCFKLNKEKGFGASERKRKEMRR